MSVFELTSVIDTTLWKQLRTGFQGRDAAVATTLAQNLISICKEAADRMRNFPSLHPQYTLHDQIHLLRVTELMAYVLPPDVIQSLNPAEIAILILAAHFHDQGMVMESGEIDALDSNPDFAGFRQNWELEHSNLREVRTHIADPTIRGAEQERFRKVEHEILSALLTDYIRRTHGDRSANFVKLRYGVDPRWIIEGTNIADLVSIICRSHVYEAAKLIPAQGFRYDEAIGSYRINVPYLALVLRLADILDFDRERTPDSLYRTIDFTSRISLQEWEKHRSVQGWRVEEGLVQFTMKCDQPEYQRAAYQFMDWIDQELSDGLDIIRSFPAPFQRYRWHLPSKTDKSRIEAKDDKYIYYDLEFSLSRDEVIKLLMMDELYGGPWLCVRELIQNSLDALRYRKAIFKRDSGTDWPHGKVSLDHFVDEQGHEVVRCIDNGSGMDEEIIKRFLTRVGRSFYRSPSFDQERVTFKAAGVDFDPCAQFGIGFMSCFMLGDRIRIRSKRDYGAGRQQGKPLSIEINGLGGMIVIREGTSEQQVGTTVEITGRKKPGYLEQWTDDVRLTSVVRGYALACEFPIEAMCSIPEIADSTALKPGPAAPATLMERLHLKNIVTFSQEFSAISPFLFGEIRTSVLLDEKGNFCVGNEEASWAYSEMSARRLPALKLPNGTLYQATLRDNQTCIDGILVAGEPGQLRGRKEPGLGTAGNPIYSGNAEFILDIRGPIKPPLTPSRTPPFGVRNARDDPRWRFIQYCAKLAEGRLWEQIIARHGLGPPLVLWQLALLYRAPLTSMRSRIIWESIQIAIIEESPNVKWETFSGLDYLVISIDQDKFHVRTKKGAQLATVTNVIGWMLPAEYGQPFQNIVVAMASLEKAGQELRLRMVPPDEGGSPPIKLRLGQFDSAPSLPFLGELKSLVSLKCAQGITNSKHPIVRYALDSQFAADESELQRFCRAIISLMTGNASVSFPPANQTMPLRYRYIGGIYRSIDWPSVPANLHPPYSSISLTGEIVSIDASMLERWADAKPERES